MKSLALILSFLIAATSTFAQTQAAPDAVAIKEALGIYTGKPMFPRSPENYICMVESTYVWRDGKITLYKPGLDKGDFSLNIDSDGRSEIHGGSYDWDGKWSEYFILVEATETKRELAQPDHTVVAEAAVLRLIQNRNPKGEFDFNYRGGLGQDAVFKSGKCVRQ